MSSILKAPDPILFNVPFLFLTGRIDGLRLHLLAHVGTFFLTHFMWNPFRLAPWGTGARINRFSGTLEDT